MTVEIVNPVAREDVGGWARTMATTFLRDPASEQTMKWIEALGRNWDPARSWGARAGGRWVATLRTESRTLTVPRGPGATAEVDVDALTNVTVAATHRRQGILRRMLDSSLRAAKARGDALSILIAAEWPIYGRFGYAPATLSGEYVLRRSRAGAILPGEPSRLRQLDRDGFAAVAPEVFAAARRRRAGQVDRDGDWWNRALGRDGYAPPDGLAHNWLIHDGDDGPDGLLAWKATTDTGGLIPPLDSAEVWLLAAATDVAYRNLWAYLGGIDLVDEIRLANRPVDEPVRWLLPDARTLVATEIVDLLWLRVLNVPAALTARRYAMAGEVVLEVHDEPGADFASGRFRLHAEGDEVSCRATEDPVDLELSQRALASIYLGGFRLHELSIAGAVHEHTRGSLATVDLMFSTPLAPWNATWF